MNYRMYIDGRWVDAHNGGSWKVIDPATEETVQEVPFGDGADAEDAIAAAARAQPRWAAMTAYERGAILRRRQTSLQPPGRAGADHDERVRQAVVRSTRTMDGLRRHV